MSIFSIFFACITLDFYGFDCVERVKGGVDYIIDAPFLWRNEREEDWGALLGN